MVMKHKMEYEQKYEMSLSELEDILERHFDHGAELKDDLLLELKEYASKADHAVSYDEITHELRLLFKSSKYKWDLFTITKKVLDQELIQALKDNNEIRVESILNKYTEMFRNKKADAELEKKLDEYFTTLEENEEIHTRLVNAVNSRSLSLIIGAGLTARYVGSWDNLLKELMIMRIHSSLMSQIDGSHEVKNDRIREYMEQHIKTFIGDNVNYLERGEYLRYDADDNSAKIGTAAEERYRELFFAEQVRQVVIEKTAGIEKKYIQDQFINKDKRLGTLSAVINLCVKKNIKEIVTYNFDTILDRLIADGDIREKYDPAKKNIRVEVYSYFQPEPVLVLPKHAKETWDTVRIYHVHGVLDKDIKEVHPIIFSENSYQNYQKTALNWSNIRIADIQSRNNVLCVGFSGDDPNFRSLRRIFDETNTNPVMGRTSAFSVFLMRDYSADKSKLLDQDTDANDIDLAFACIKTYFDMIISYFKKQYKVDIVWSYTFGHMADQIHELADL